MLSSMTGFARRIESTGAGELFWEIRSVNHRSLVISINLPELYRPLDANLRRVVADRLHRGKIDASLRFSSGVDFESEQLDRASVAALMEHANQVQEMNPRLVDLSTAEVLRWPGVLSSSVNPDEELQNLIIETFVELVDDLAVERNREGLAIQELLKEKINEIKQLENNIRESIPAALDAIKARLMGKINELKSVVDPERFEQEVALLIIKADVIEEIDRLGIHIQEFSRVLEHESNSGKRLGFILQEMNREVNTLSSKAAYYPITALAIDMKVELEQIREQLLNVV